MSLLEVQNLCKKFNRVDALSSVSLSIQEGEIYGIIGLSGAGKSTLLRCLAGLLTPTSGEILFEGTPLSSLPRRAFYQKIGMIFQHFNLFSARTVYENVSYPLEVAGLKNKTRIDELLKLVGLSEKKEAYPATLSGGEKQRVGIARALANSPRILFCDEATSALDPKTTKEILNLLKKVNKELGITIVLITHDMEVIRSIADRVAVIEGGKIVEEGDVVKLFTDAEHPTTKRLIERTPHDLPELFFKPASPNRKLLRLHFHGSSTEEPVISQLVKRFDLDANILLGWIDPVQSTTIGTLIVELTGSQEGIEKALLFLAEKNVYYEEIKR